MKKIKLLHGDIGPYILNVSAQDYTRDLEQKENLFLKETTVVGNLHSQMI